jgi:glycerophosphoryl diester phosphodiesterase
MASSVAGRTPAVQGHRGARAVLPENTLPAFEYAIKVGVDAIELDIAVTKDNVPVVSHDPIPNATICSGPRRDVPIRQMTLAEVRQFDCGSKKNPDYPKQKPVPGARIPALDEVLALSPRGNFDFNIETKLSARHPEYAPSPEEFARLILDAVRKHKLERRVIVQSFDFRTLQAMKKLAPEIRLSALYDGPAKDFTAISTEAGGTAIVAPQYRLVTKEQVDKAHAAGLRVIPWTPNTQPEWERLIGTGVDAIITDDPAELIQFLRSR